MKRLLDSDSLRMGLKVLVSLPFAVCGCPVGVIMSICLQQPFASAWNLSKAGNDLVGLMVMISLFFPWFIGPLSRLVFPPLRELSNSSWRIEKWSRILGVLYFLTSCLGLLFVLFGLDPLTQYQKRKNAARWTGRMATEWATDQWTDELGTGWATDQWTDKMVAERARGKENASNPNAGPAAVDTGPVAALEALGAAIERDASGNVVKVNCHRNEKITDGDLVHLKGLTKLKALRLSYAQITDAGLVHLRGLTTLRLLDLNETQITDAGLINLQEFTDLKWLYLNEPLVTDTGLVHLKGLTNLKTLSLSYTEVTDTGLVHLKGLTNLESLYLGRTKVTDAGVAELQEALPNCDISW